MTEGSTTIHTNNNTKRTTTTTTTTTTTSSAAAAAYLKHINEKKKKSIRSNSSSSNNNNKHHLCFIHDDATITITSPSTTTVASNSFDTTASDDCTNHNNDHRQTIISPTKQEVDRLTILPSTSNCSSITSPSAELKLFTTTTSTTTNATTGSLRKKNKTKKHKLNNRKSTTTSPTQNKIIMKPPLGKRSVISDATNSTYLSSDSEEECCNETVNSGSHYSGISSNKSYKSNKSSNSNNNINSSSGPVISHSNRTNDDNTGTNNQVALVPYNEERSSHRSRRSFIPADYTNGIMDTDDLAEFQYSDNEDDNNNNNVKATENCYYIYDDDEDSAASSSAAPARDLINYSSSNNSTSSDSLVDLDQLIQESSSRWKQSVTETVRNSITANTSSGYYVTPSALEGSTSSIMSQHIKRLSNGGGSTSSNETFSAAAAAINTNSIIEEQQAEIEALRAALQNQHVTTSTTTTSDHDDRPTQEVVLVPQKIEVNTTAATTTIQAQDYRHDHGIHIGHIGTTSAARAGPLHQEIVTTTHHQDCNNNINIGCCNDTIQDDLTVWSGFQSVSQAPPLLTNRNYTDDTASVAPPPTKTVTALPLLLSSSTTGVTRHALFTGKVSQCDECTYRNTTIITGQGILQFIETGDVYRGDIIDNEMHGYGTYTFNSQQQNHNQGQQQVLHGQFENNVYIG